MTPEGADNPPSCRVPQPQRFVQAARYNLDAVRRERDKLTPEWPVKVRRLCPVSTSHSFTVLSSCQTTWMPLGENLRLDLSGVPRENAG